MKFILLKDKRVNGNYKTGGKQTFVEAGTYPVVRIFDKDWVIVQLNYSTSYPMKRQITLLRIKKGKLTELDK